MKVRDNPTVNSCGRLLNSLHGSGFTSFVPGFDYDSHVLAGFGVESRRDDCRGLSLCTIVGFQLRFLEEFDSDVRSSFRVWGQTL